MTPMQTIVVTGAAGFIGSHLVGALLDRGDTVIGIDEFNDYYDPQLKRANIAPYLNHERFRLVENSLNELDLSSLLEGVSIVFHQAAQAGVRASWGRSFDLYTERNITATQMLLEAAKDCPSLERLVYASSSSVYGNAAAFPTSEAVLPQPVSPYGVTKLAAEHLCQLYHVNYGVPTTSLRYFTVYGPRQRPDMAFHKFLKAILHNEAIPIYGDGLQTRDFTFIADAVAANLAAASRPEAIGEAFNIGGGSRVVLRDVIALLETIVDQPIQIDWLDPSRGDARHTSADTTKAQTQIGYAPKVGLAEGLAREWEWIQQVYGEAKSS